jgi:hypothetical protein
VSPENLVREQPMVGPHLTPRAFRGRLLVVIGLSVAMSGAVLLVPRFAQPAWYHDFADSRCLLGVPNLLNVVSNLPFVAVGVLGVLFLFSGAARRPGGSFLEASERWPYALLFAAIALTGVGSAYYHWDPGNDRLLWDRLPLAVAFMTFFAITIGERIDLNTGYVLLGPLVVLGGGSVVYWHLSEIHGAGDLRLYLFVQLYPLLAIPLLMLLFPPRYTRSADLVAALLCYLLAKALELLDAQVYAQGGHVSGHTLKHLVAGLSGWWLLHMVRQRRPVGVAPARAATALGRPATTR